MKSIKGLASILFLFLAVAITLPAYGQQVSADEARSIASQFLRDRGIGTKAADAPADVAPISRGSSLSGPAYYIYNDDNNNVFVIVSGDKRTERVFGYGTKGAYNPDDVPESMQFMLNQFAEAVESLGNDACFDELQSGEINEPVIYPILNTEWGQDAPFNFMCPQINEEHCVTGCVATSMAQVMYYYKWPHSTSKEIPGYTQRYYDLSGTTYPALPTTTFDWSVMRDYYSRHEMSPTSVPNASIAKLLRYCGQSVEMDYDIYESGAFDACEVFVDYFRFSAKARKLYRIDYSDSQWETFVRNELNAGRPILYSGYKNKKSTGHSFVCDGYDGRGYYHFNWGWYGSKDGFFLLSLLNPGDQKKCSILKSAGYNVDQQMIIGLEPDTVYTTEKNAVTMCSNVSIDEYTQTRASASEPFEITISVRHDNDSPVDRIYDMGWGVFLNDGFTLHETFPDLYTNCDLYGNWGIKLTDAIEFGKNYIDGIYYLRPIARESGDDVWKPCHYSGKNFIRVIIDGNTLTLTAVNDGNVATDYSEIYQ